MVSIQTVSPATSNTQITPVNAITNDQINTRMTELINSEPKDKVMTKQDAISIVALRNNIMLDKVLANQNIIMEKLGLGQKLDIKG